MTYFRFDAFCTRLRRSNIQWSNLWSYYQHMVLIFYQTEFLDCSFLHSQGKLYPIIVLHQPFYHKQFKTTQNKSLE